MQIQWFGLSYFKIQTKDAVILVNPYAPKFGLKAPHFKADILLVSQESEEYNFRPAALGNPFTICSPGEYELKDVFIYAVPFVSENKKEPEKMLTSHFLIEAEGITLAFLAGLKAVPAEEQLERFNEVDILFIPVGGKEVLGAEGASKVISEIEPRIVVPMHYRTSGLKLPLEGVNSFCREMGVKESESLDKLKISLKDLPQEETKVFLLKS
ncbi:MAG: MBL fold metallo-hydrolase [Patescibacteria group bacterium]